MKVINLTQHKSTLDQQTQGVFDLPASSLEELQRLLTFETLPSPAEILSRAEAIAKLAASTDAASAMIGGAPYLMGALEAALRKRGITPLYAFSVRESVDRALPDGSIQKTSVFKHVGFVQPPTR